jgi:hypothetical protein
LNSQRLWSWIAIAVRRTRNPLARREASVNQPSRVRWGSARTRPMKLIKDKISQAGAAGYMLLWLLGVPIPVLLLIFLLRGCS